jgi:hypothetical protein
MTVFSDFFGFFGRRAHSTSLRAGNAPLQWVTSRPLEAISVQSDIHGMGRLVEIRVTALGDGRTSRRTQASGRAEVKMSALSCL